MTPSPTGRDTENRALGDTLAESLIERGVQVSVPEDVGAPVSQETCCRLRGAAGAVFDISLSDLRDEKITGLAKPNRTPRYRGGSREVLPLIEVGYAIGARIPHACIFDEGRGPIKSPMLPEHRCSIPRASVERGLTKFADWFIRDILRRGK